MTTVRRQTKANEIQFASKSNNAKLLHNLQEAYGPSSVTLLSIKDDDNLLY